MSIFKKLAIPVLSTFLALAPLKSQALEGIVKNSITDQGIPQAIVRLYKGDALLDSCITDENGYYNVNETSVKEPDFNIPNQNNYPIKVFDINGRFLYKLDENWNGTTIPNLPSGAYIFQTPYNAFVSPVIEGNLLSPLQKPLTERVRTGKSVNKTSNADETYTLSVSDDGIANEIRDYYDASIPVDSLNATRDVELIPFYDMQDWDGDFLEYLNIIQRGGTIIWGDYPEYYPINVDMDSASCSEYCGDRTEMYLRTIRDALDLWNEKTGLDLFNYVNVTENNRQIRVDYSRNAFFDPEYAQDEDGRWRIDSGVVYLINDIQDNQHYLQTQAEHEFGHATGWGPHAPNEESVMAGPHYVHISDDDGKVVETFTTLKNNTYWSTYLQE